MSLFCMCALSFTMETKIPTQQYHKLLTHAARKQVKGHTAKMLVSANRFNLRHHNVREAGNTMCQLWQALAEKLADSPVCWPSSEAPPGLIRM